MEARAIISLGSARPARDVENGPSASSATVRSEVGSRVALRTMTDDADDADDWLGFLDLNEPGALPTFTNVRHLDALLPQERRHAP